MKIRRDTQKTGDGVMVTTEVVMTDSERDRVRAIVDGIRDLAGVTTVGGQDVYDTTASIMMTEARKRIFADAADLLLKTVYGDD